MSFGLAKRIVRTSELPGLRPYTGLMLRSIKLTQNEGQELEAHLMQPAVIQPTPWGILIVEGKNAWKNVEMTPPLTASIREMMGEKLLYVLFHRKDRQHERLLGEYGKVEVMLGGLN
jgi:hypothetical protein